MHDYQGIRYHDVNDAYIDTWEVDSDGVPSHRLFSTFQVEGLAAIERFVQKFQFRVNGLEPYSCECSQVFRYWWEVQEHLQIYCLHVDFDESMDGSAKCRNCGLEKPGLDEESEVGA